jgi:uncharacterized membrane protein HdeD (DUF308 family)
MTNPPSSDPLNSNPLGSNPLGSNPLGSNPLESDPLGIPLASVAKGIWWMVLIRGIFAIIFGIIALIAPGAALTGVAIVFGVYALVDGIAEIVHSTRTRKTDSKWGWLLFQGIVSVLAGLVALIFPGLVGVIGGLFLLWTIVFYAIIHGVMGLASAAGVSDSKGRTWGIVSGILTIVFGVVLAILIFATPGATVLSLIWIVGIYAIIFGIMLVIAAVQVRRAVSSATTTPGGPRTAQA